jgi:ATP-binding cassette subfamily F protein 3
MLDKMDLLHEEANNRSIAIRFPPCEKSGKDVLDLVNISKNYDSLQVLHGIDLHLYRGEKVAFVGVNGAGKSTLFRLMAGVEEPTSGSVTMGLNVKMAFFSQESAANLHYDHHVWLEVQSVPSKANDQERRNLLGAFLFSGDDIYKPVSVLSGGEKSRLVLLKILLQGSNFLVLDEPTNHLDLKSKEIFQNALLQYEGTMAIVSHDRYFLDCLATRVIELKEGRAIEYGGDYSYFIEKRRENQLLLKEEELRDKIDTDQGGEDSRGYKTREARRREAEERNRLSRNLKPLRDKLAALEVEIAHLEARQNDCETELCQPDIHTRPDRIRNLTLEIKTIRQQLEDRYEEWEELLERIEAETQSGAI